MKKIFPSLFCNVDSINNKWRKSKYSIKFGLSSFERNVFIVSDVCEKYGRS